MSLVEIHLHQHVAGKELALSMSSLTGLNQLNDVLGRDENFAKLLLFPAA